jgi:hypothetical protein
MMVAYQTIGGAHVQELDLPQDLRDISEPQFHREIMLQKPYKCERLPLHRYPNICLHHDACVQEGSMIGWVFNRCDVTLHMIAIDVKYRVEVTLYVQHVSGAIRYNHSLGLITVMPSQETDLFTPKPTPRSQQVPFNTFRRLLQWMLNIVFRVEHHYLSTYTLSLCIFLTCIG